MWKIILILFCGPLISIFSVNGLNVKSKDKLIFAQVIWRHGDRAPVGSYPTNPNKEEIWNYGWGELTQRGMEQQFSLGQLLRQRYVLQEKLLDERYNPKQIYIRSTDVNRTLISAMSNLAGMFPAGERGHDFPNTTTWPTNWTPIPVHTIPEPIDYAGNVFTPCPRALQLRKKIEAYPTYKTTAQENRKFFQYISEMAGHEYNFSNIFELNDIIYCEMAHNVSQPEWVSPSVISQLRNLTQIATRLYLGIDQPYLPELIRIRGGNMLKLLIENMKTKLDCTKNPEISNCKWFKNLRYYAFSAHDTTLAALLSTFGDEEAVIPGGLPHYTASIAVELWQTEEFGPAVKILYHSSFNHNYHVITDLTKGCPKGNEYCSLDTFEKRSNKFIPEDILKECKAIPFQYRFLKKSKKNNKKNIKKE